MPAAAFRDRSKRPAGEHTVAESALSTPFASRVDDVQVTWSADLGFHAVGRDRWRSCASPRSRALCTMTAAQHPVPPRTWARARLIYRAPTPTCGLGGG